MTEPAPELALAAICRELLRLGRRFALVGGLAVSVRAEVRFTRDVDIVVAVADDSEAESLTYELRLAGYTAVASVEHETRHRLSTVRLMSPSGVKVDLLFASSGIETEIVDRATPIDFEGAGSVPVANAEELLAMKVLSMTRVSLETVVYAFNAGSSAEEIVEQYPSLSLSNVYAVISYALDNRQSVDEYVALRRPGTHALRAEIEKRWPAHGLRDRLLARSKKASPG